jgi:threonine-phosphate decarboxylase
LYPYEHGGDIYGNRGVALDFSVSTNPLGMPEAVRESLITRVDEFARYPDPQCRGLRAAIARHEQVPEDWVLCGNGAADLIVRLCRAVNPRSAVTFPPAFSEYERALKQTGSRVMYQALGERLPPDADILFLCHPNNPTGQLIREDWLESILTQAAQNGTVAVVDECFLDFTEGVSAKRALGKIPGLVILKAFTKIYAMAGLRLGYLLTADRLLLDKVSAAAQCWSVSVPAQIAGVAALGCAGWAEKTRRLVAAERGCLTEEISRLGITVFPSDANFLLLRCETPLYEPLLQKGILIRSCANFQGLDETHYRIGVKMRDENRRLLRAVREVLHG